MIDRMKVIKGLECCREMNGHACQKCPYVSDCNNLSAGIPHLASDALELLKEQLEIVRCKDCKYGEQCIPPCEDRYCVFYDQRHDGDWFCGDGEVRQDE